MGLREGRLPHFVLVSSKKGAVASKGSRMLGIRPRDPLEKEQVTPGKGERKQRFLSIPILVCHLCSGYCFLQSQVNVDGTWDEAPRTHPPAGS